MGAHFEFANSEKQQEIMKVVLAAADLGQSISLRELQTKLSYGPSVRTQSIGCSVKFLVKHGFVVAKFRGCKGTFITPTAQAYPVFRGSGASEFSGE